MAAANIKNEVDWMSKGAIKSKMVSAKSAVTRACTAISMLVKRQYIYSSQQACEEAKAQLEEAYRFLADLHDRYEDLETQSPTDVAAENTQILESMTTYENKYYAALDQLNAYIAASEAASVAAIRTAQGAAAPSSSAPKLTACKLLFPTQLTKTTSPVQFRLWTGAFQRFYDASGLAAQNLATQQGFLLKALDEDLGEVIAAKITPTMRMYGPSGCMELLEAEFRVLYPIFSRRLDFFQSSQDAGEDSADYLHRVCAAKDMADLDALNPDDLAVFKFVAGCNDKRLREKLFEAKRRDLTAVKEIVGQHSSHIKDEKALSSHPAKTIAAVNPAPQAGSQGRPQRGRGRGRLPPELKDKCTACGNSSHRVADCQIRKNKPICNNCGKEGHLSKVCFQSLRQKAANRDRDQKNDDPPPYSTTHKGQKPVNAVSTGGWRETTDQYSDESDADEVWKRLPLTINHINGSFQFNAFPDTGSAATLIAEDVARREGMTATENVACKYINVSGDTVPTQGAVPIHLSLKHRSNHSKQAKVTPKDLTIKAVITPAIKNEVIIGRNDLKRLKIIPKQFPSPIMVVSPAGDDRQKCQKLKQKLIHDNPKVLTDDLPEDAMDGCMMKIHLTPGDKKPFRISTARQIPLHWREKAERIVTKLIKERVITRQDEPTEWCAPGFFVVKKNGDLRLVVDFTKLNKFVRRPVHTFPSTQEILSGLDPTSKVFAKLDATQGYHQVPLEESSSKLTTFLLPSGRFRFLRAPMGLSCSSDEFCRRSDQVIEGIPGVRKLVDDVLVQAPDMKTLEDRINILINRCREHNFTLSRRKLEIGDTVEFAGQIVSKEGVSPDPKYLQGIRDFPAPRSPTELRSFLGMINQIATYHPGLAAHTSVLQALLKKDTAYLWLEEHQTAFDQLRHNVIQRLGLNHFDSTWHTQLVTDASRLHGVGFALIQRKGDQTKIIQCGSRSLSPAEKRYSTLELELTAIVWAIQKCRYFLKGMEAFEVITDHKPLVGIFGKCMTQLDNSRVIRLREKVQDYAFDVKWTAGKENVIADALSRAPAASTDGATSMPVRACIAAPKDIKASLAQGAEQSEAYTMIREAFKQNRRLADLPCDHPARRLKQVWDKISMTDEGILTVDGDKIYLPPSVRQTTLQDIHKGHCGYSKTLQTARKMYYWPSMKHDIRTMIDKCEACQRLLPSKPSETLINTTADHPMEKISMDLFHANKRNYLVTVDRYSGYFWVDALRDTSTKAVTDALDRITRVFGLPISCRTDGGPQFRGPFDKYCDSKGIHHEVSSPYHPQSNGHAEAAVKAAKYLILKTTPTEFPDALAAWRNTARDDKPSPNEMMFKRLVRDTKPIVIPEAPEKTPTQHIPDKANIKFAKGDRVIIQDHATRRWTDPATVTSVSQSGRTLELLSDEGHVIRRNRRFVRPLCATR